jgi:ketosteroid isomerase-like protein
MVVPIHWEHTFALISPLSDALIASYSFSTIFLMSRFVRTLLLLVAPCAVTCAQIPSQPPPQPSTSLPGISAAPSFDPLGKGPTLNPLTMPTLSPGELELVKLEGDFSDAVAKGGGKAFASWFAEDGVTLQNGKPPVRGRTSIAASAVWDPKDYQLTWYAEGAQMNLGGESGFTWGHYTSIAKDKNGQPVTLSGRTITVWKKVHGEWKVALDASAEDIPATDCCTLPKP